MPLQAVNRPMPLSLLSVKAEKNVGMEEECLQRNINSPSHPYRPKCSR